MRGHNDTVTGMELSPDGSYLLTTAMDNTRNQEFCVHVSENSGLFWSITCFKDLRDNYATRNTCIIIL